MTIKGNGISSGLSMGTAVMLEKKPVIVPDVNIANVEEEIAAFRKAHKEALTESDVLFENASRALSEKEAAIFASHRDILQDEASLIEPIVSLIQENGWNAAKATDYQMQQIISIFESSYDDYMRLRASDMRDVRLQLLRHLLGIEEPDLSALPDQSVIVSNEITPSDIGKMDLSRVTGFISQVGGPTSHFSIIARSLEIPAVSQIQEPRRVFSAGMRVILDGDSGEIQLEPDERAVSSYLKHRKEMLEQKAKSQSFKLRPTVTADGHALQLWANIGSPRDVDKVLESGAEGVGLFRSEFLYMDCDSPPDEEGQFAAYKTVVERLSPRPVVIRTLDIGGDKELPALDLEKETNPFLGYRAIRLCLDRPELFITQLRALLRASAYGDLRIMFPMIASIEELRRAKQMVEQVKRELTAAGLPYNKHVPIGMMIEVPSSAILADIFAEEVDFFSIGTNDLTQYTLAADRGNAKVANIYDVSNPAVLMLIKRAIEAARRHNIPCGLCGEAGADPAMQPFLIGCGIDELSMTPSAILRSRMTISELNFEECRKTIERIPAF